MVPGASITIADTEHGINRTVKSNGNGEYTLSSLPVGNYVLTVGAPNFETSVITDIKVDANANIKELLTLTAGSTSDQVTVQDTAAR